MIQLLLYLFWAVLENVEARVHGVLVQFDGDLELENVKQGLQIWAVCDDCGPVFLLQKEQTVYDWQHFLETLQVLHVYQIILVLNAEVADIWDHVEVLESAEMAFDALHAVNYDGVLLVPVVVSLAQDGLQAFEQLGDCQWTQILETFVGPLGQLIVLLIVDELGQQVDSVLLDELLLVDCVRWLDDLAETNASGLLGIIDAVFEQFDDSVDEAILSGERLHFFVVGRVVDHGQQCEE